MAFEYQSLAFLAVLFLLAWLPVSIGKWRVFGGRWLGSNRVPVPGKELEPWAARCERAYNNLKDFFPAFVVAILLLGMNGKFDQGTQWAAGLFVFGRIAHYVSYGLGSVPSRALFFFMGLLSNAYLLIKIFI